MEIVIILFVVAIIVAAIIGSMRAKKRQRELQAWAEAGGLSFTQSRNAGYDDRHPRFEALHSGSNRYAYNIMTGSRNGREIHAFDYHYETHSTDSKGRRQTHHHYFSAVILDHGLPFASLFIRPEGFFDKVSAFFGYEDINFELDAFNRAFHVKCPDRKFAFDVIHQATMEHILAAPRFTLDFEGPRVMVYRSRCFKPQEFETALCCVEGILDRLPNYLLQDLAARKGEIR